MNLLIEKLANMCEHTTVDPYGQLTTNHDFELFARLIVEECVNAFEEEVDSWLLLDKNIGAVKRQGVRAMKQQFGIKG